MGEGRVMEPSVICVGANQESLTALRGLVQRNARIVALVTLAVDAKRKRLPSDFVDMRQFCHETDIAIVETTNINSDETVDRIRKFNPDFIYTLGWSQLFKDAVLQVPTHYVVGSHPSPLPDGRGRAPVPWTILQDLRQSAVTLFRMSSDVDDGPILIQRPFEIPQRAYASDVYQLVSESLRDAFCDLYEAHRSGRALVETAQDPRNASYRAKRGPADGHLDFSDSAARLERLIRAVSHPYPGAYAYYRGRKITIWKADVCDVPAHVGCQGQVLAKRDQRLLVHAGDRPLWLYDFADGNEQVPAEVFRIGAKFGFAVEDDLAALWQRIHDLEKRLSFMEGRDHRMDAA